jgi:hypothetical protein
MLIQHWEIDCRENKATVQVGDRFFIFCAQNAKIQPEIDRFVQPERYAVYLYAFPQDIYSALGSVRKSDFSQFLLEPDESIDFWLGLRPDRKSLTQTADGRLITFTITFDSPLPVQS